MPHLRDELETMVQQGLPGAFVYVEERDGNAWFFTAGYADLASHRRMTPDSHYRISSTTKSFTAVVALRLVAEGQMTLHDTIQQWLPDLPIPNAETLTVEHLLRMRSGLADFEETPTLLHNLEAHRRPYSSLEAIHLALAQPATFAPGAQFAYCNTNFCLLEQIIERVSGQSFATALQQRIFTPLSLRNSVYPKEADLTLPEPYIRGYEHTASEWQECSEVFFGRGDGALISTALDQARFFRALFEGALLPADRLRQMMIVTPDTPPARFAYGLGLIADPLPHGTVWGHPGGGYGYYNYAFFDRTSGRMVRL
ncbi:MAG: beta-lactamase family protein [Blastochloris sp.]|nr:beta-lactamase family protein [Blastochloris sp.]